MNILQGHTTFAVLCDFDNPQQWWFSPLSRQYHGCPLLDPVSTWVDTLMGLSILVLAIFAVVCRRSSQLLREFLSSNNQ